MTQGDNTKDAIAVVGMAGRFPGACDLETFWRNLAQGVESISEFSDEELAAAGLDRRVWDRADFVRAGGVLDGIDQFDAGLFRYSPREVEAMDPQHRLFLECAWEALESAGYHPERCPGATGVFGGVGLSGYLLQALSNRAFLSSLGDYQTVLLHGNDKDHLTTRVSYKLNLRGPSFDVQTACSTSLVAIHLACQHLLSYQCDMALAGGVSLTIPQRTGYRYRPGGILSPDGHCRAFDAQAQGTVFGSGVGVVVLRRLEDALADGDVIRAVVRGSAINNDGAGKIGYTAPSLQGQVEVIELAQAISGVSPEHIRYVEAHGTGTSVGDPIEVEALTEVFRRKTQARQFCALGSVKTNVGHLNTAAGVAGFIKTVLALERGAIPPSLHYVQPNPKIDFANSPFFVNTRLRSWDRATHPRCAGVSSFGIGGTNAHVVLEEAPPAVSGDRGREWKLLVVSARSAEARDRSAQSLAEHLEANASQDLEDVAWTLQQGRKAFDYRAGVVCRTAEEAAGALKRGGQWQSGPVESDRPVIFLLSGQGSQYAGMGKGLYEREKVYREVVDRCAKLLDRWLGRDLRSVLGQGLPGESGAALDGTEWAQPALFVVEYALASLWASWGVQPAGMIGHSLGEYTAACLAGVLRLEDALKLVSVRGRLMQRMPKGAMTSVMLGVEELASWMEGSDLSIAAVNGPALCVVSGPVPSVERFEQSLHQAGKGFRRLVTSHAFHSSMMEPIMEPFRQELRTVKLSPPQRRFISNVTGQWIRSEEATDPEYWVRHLRQTVLFGEGIKTSLELGAVVFLEVGPGRALSHLARAQIPAGSAVEVLNSLRHPQEKRPDQEQVLLTLGRLWSSGVSVDWSGFHAGEKRRRVRLPTYPFERQRYWIEATAPAAAPVATSRNDDVASWFYVTGWKRKPLGLSGGDLSAGRWLVFAGEDAFSEFLVRQLESRGEVIRVQMGARLTRAADRSLVINPADASNYVSLLEELKSEGRLPEQIVHAWAAVGDQEQARAACEQQRNFFSLLYLAQACGQVVPGGRFSWTVVTRHLFQVTGDERLEPWEAGVRGPCLVIPQEYPGVTCRHVDLAAGRDGVLGEAAVASLVEELMSASEDPVAAYRNGLRWVESVERIRWEGEAGGAPVLRQRGTYLITGGLGGIGSVLAEHLAEHGQARLVLTGRSALPQRDQWNDWLARHDEADGICEKIRIVQALELKGAEVMVVAADVADGAQMASVFREVRQRFGELHGVIHAAGIAGGGIAALKTAEAARQVLASKVKGTLVLHEFTRGMNLDFLIVCSSVNAALGGPGQVDYAAANAFLDAFATWDRSTHGSRTMSVSWDTWQEVGMAVKTLVPDAMRLERQQSLRLGIVPREGKAVFSRLLGRPLSHVVISPRDFGGLKEQWRAVRAAPPASTLSSGAARSRHARPQLRGEYVAPRTEAETLIVSLWEELLGLEPVGVEDNFFELGGHSLLGVQLSSRLRETFKVELPMAVLFERPTVAALAEVVVQRQEAEVDAETLARLMEEIGAMPEEEVQKQLEIARQQQSSSGSAGGGTRDHGK